MAHQHNPTTRPPLGASFIHERCPLTGPKLSGYVDHELSPEEMAQYTLHLTVCDECRLEVDGERRVKALFRQSRLPDSPPGFVARVRSRLWSA